MNIVHKIDVTCKKINANQTVLVCVCLCVYKLEKEMEK